MAEENRTMELHEIQAKGTFGGIVGQLNDNFARIIEAILKKRDGKSAYEIWVEEPGNEGKTLNEFFASLKESGFTSKAVTVLPTGSEISENTIYAVPEKSDESLQSPDRWAEYIRKDNSWILLAQHTGAGLGELIANFANLRKEVADMIGNAMYADIKNYTSGKIINGDGTISDNDAYCLSEYIPVEYGQKIRFWLGNTTARLNVYNSNRQGLMSDCYKNSSSANPPESASNPRTVTLNANIFTTAAYFRMSFPKSKASEAYAQVLNALDEVISEWRPEEKVLKSSTQKLTKEQIATVLDNLNMRTGVENGNVITFTGKGDTVAWSVTDRVTLIPKHTYRLWLQDTDWSLDGITVTSSGYDKLNFFIYNNPDGVLRNEDGLYRIAVLNPAVKMTDVVKPYYDYTVPESVNINDEDIEVKEWWLRIYGRAAVGTEVMVRVEDITSLLQATSEADEDSDKTIAERLAEGNAVRLTYNDVIENYGDEVISSLNGKWIYVNGCNGKPLSELTTYSVSATAKYKTYKIPLDGVAVVDVMQYQHEYARGSVLFDSEDNAVYGIVNKSACLNAWKRIYVTGDIAYLLYTVSSDFVGSDVLVLYPEGYTIGTSERDKGLGVVTEVNGTLKDNGEILENGIIAGDGQKPAVGDNMLTWAGTSSSYTTRYIYTIIDISGYDKIDAILAFKGNSDPYGLFLDEDMVVLQRLNNPTADNVNYKYDIEIPSGAKYFVNARYYTHTLYIKVSSAGIKGQVESNTLRIEALEQGGGGGDSTQSRTISLLQGNIGQNGSPVISSSHVYTTPIQGGRGFYIELNEGYEIDCAHLYDDSNNLLAYNYIPASSVRALPMTAFYFKSSTDEGGVDANFYSDGRRRYMSNMTIPAGYSLVLVICKYTAPRGTQGATAVDISPTDDIIDEFRYLDDRALSSMIPDEIPLSVLTMSRKRVYQLASVGWKILKNIPSTSAALGNAGVFDAGKYRFGVAYSEAAQFSKYVGQHVSLYTYVTALRNRRSVMYTEKINAGATQKTEYNFEYNNLGGYSSSFYGTVCTGLTGFAMGLANVWISGSYKNNPTLLGLSAVQNYNVDGAENPIPPYSVVRPLDIVWYDGHCSIVADVLLDRDGNVKYIVWGEEVTPTPSVAAMSPEQFDFRVRDKKCIIYRKDDWSDLTEPDETPFIQLDWLDTKIDKLYNIKYNPDICTMYGDKPCLAVGDILWLNFNKTKGYANIVIEKESNGAYSVVNTITLEGNANVRTVTGEDTYSDINLASLNLAAGKYRAKLTGNGIESGYTYWELIGITLSVTKNTSNKFDVAFSAIGGTPYLLRNELMAGYMAVGTRVVELSAAEISEGQVYDLNWSITNSNGNVQNSVFKVFVRGEYGVAVKAVEHPDNA